MGMARLAMRQTLPRDVALRITAIMREGLAAGDDAGARDAAERVRIDITRRLRKSRRDRGWHVGG